MPKKCVCGQPAGGAYNVSPDPLAGNGEGLPGRERERRERGGEGFSDLILCSNFDSFRTVVIITNLNEELGIRLFWTTLCLIASLLMVSIEHSSTR